MGFFNLFKLMPEDPHEKADLQAMGWMYRKMKERKERKQREREESEKQGKEAGWSLFGRKKTLIDEDDK